MVKSFAALTVLVGLLWLFYAIGTGGLEDLSALYPVALTFAGLVLYIVGSMMLSASQDRANRALHRMARQQRFASPQPVQPVAASACPRCGQVVQHGPELSGQTLVCAACGQPFRLA